MKKLNPYSIGEAPTFDPCEKCLVKMRCSEICDDRLRWFLKNKKPKPIKLKVKGKRIR